MSYTVSLQNTWITPLDSYGLLLQRVYDFSNCESSDKCFFYGIAAKNDKKKRQKKKTFGAFIFKSVG